VREREYRENVEGPEGRGWAGPRLIQKRNPLETANCMRSADVT